MSETILKVLVAELKLARVRCMECGLVVEMPVNKLGETFSKGSCPLCGVKFKALDENRGRIADHLQALADSLAGLEAAGGQVEVGFVLTERDG